MTLVEFIATTVTTGVLTYFVADKVNANKREKARKNFIELQRARMQAQNAHATAGVQNNNSSTPCNNIANGTAPGAQGTDEQALSNLVIMSI